MPQPTHHTREGFAILAAIIGVLVLSTLTMTALEMGMQEMRSARATRVSASALYVADTGVNLVRADWPTTPISAGGSLDMGWTDLANGSKYHPVIHRRDDNLGKMRIYSLTVEGWSPGPLGGQATVQIWATRFYISARFTGAINAKGNVAVNGSPSLIDSFDSALGPYCNAEMAANTGCTLNVSSEGDVRANGSVSLSGENASIMGDVTAGDTILDLHDGITGLESEYQPKELYPVETCPDYTASMPGSVYTNPNIRIKDPYTITGGTYSFHNFVMDGGGVMEIPDGQFVKIYLSGQLKMSGTSSIINRAHNAAALSFVACNRGGTPNTIEWSVTGGSDAFFTVYAPNNDVKLAGGSTLFGAVVANDFKAAGGGAVHYDVALGRVPLSADSLSSITPRSWRQLLH